MKDLREVKVVQRLVVGQGETVKLDIEDQSIVTVKTVGGSRIEFSCQAGSSPSIAVGDDIAYLDVSIEEYQFTHKKLLDRVKQKTLTGLVSDLSRASSKES